MSHSGMMVSSFIRSRMLSSTALKLFSCSRISVLAAESSLSHNLVPYALQHSLEIVLLQPEQRSGSWIEPLPQPCALSDGIASVSDSLSVMTCL